MKNLIFKQLYKDNTDDVLKIIRQPSLKNPKNQYHDVDKRWIEKIIEYGYAIGGYLDDVMISCALAEELLDGGVILWFIAVSPNQQSNGYGKLTLIEFERFLKSIRKEWIFLNATINSLDFYKKGGYSTGESSTVYEHLKYL